MLMKYKQILILFFVFISAVMQVCAQGCPPNIDFENGTFSSWKTFAGRVSAQGGSNVISLLEGSPRFNQHEMFSRALHSSLVDEFGGFPVVCPNGSGYSVKLGNKQGGAGAEGLAYEFTIPANRTEYSLTYYYAVVFEGPDHAEYQQPRLEIEVLNVSDNTVIDCSSFTFISYGSGLPGFQISSTQVYNNVPVLYKDWTPVTINLNNKAGKTIRIFFKTADCTFVRHFGYAYVDVNSECNGEFPGAVFCPNDAFVSVTAPYGFQQYRWFNADFSRLLGLAPELTLSPVPPSGSLLAVEVTPFPGFGCKDTIYTKIVDTLKVKANAGGGVRYCGTYPVLIGKPPQPGRKYSWLPAEGLSDPFLSNPLASPQVTTKYVLTVSSNGGGCSDKDSVVVEAVLPDTSLRVRGRLRFCSASNDSAVLIAADNLGTQWYKNGVAIPGSTQKRFRATSSGTYYAAVKNEFGCVLKTRSVQIQIDDPVKPVTYPVRYTLADRRIQLQARKIGDSALWQPPLHLSNEKIFDPGFEHSRLGTFSYTIRIVSPAGCVTVDTQVVRVIDRVEVFVPNAFTPNYDGLNDFFQPILIGIEDIKYFRVYDRYGVEVFSASNQKSGWNGMYKNKPQPPGTYVWYFGGTAITGETYFRKGTVVLIR